MPSSASLLNRRELFCTAAAVAATGGLPSTLVADSPADVQAKPLRIVDTNVSLFRWPFRRLPLDEVSALVERFRILGIDQAWAGSFEGLLHRDLAAVNQRLVDACLEHPQLLPIGSVNPTLPNWERDLQLCLEQHQLSGIRLHPNYHGYSLDDPRFAACLQQAAQLNGFVQICLSMEDLRTQHPAVQVADVDPNPLIQVLPRIPAARVQLLNHRLTGTVLQQLGQCGGIYFDTARVDSTDGVPRLVGSVAQERVLFGSHAPFLVPEAALIRVHESDLLNSAELDAVYSQNAARLLKGSAA